MDKINLNLYGLGYQTGVEKKDDKKAEDKQPATKDTGKNVEPGKMLDAMAISGAQNLVFSGVNQVNPKDYLDDEAVARIQASVHEFANAIETYSNQIAAEFPNLSPAQREQLALQMVLKNVA